MYSSKTAAGCRILYRAWSGHEEPRVLPIGLRTLRIRDFPPFNPFSDPFDYSVIRAAVDQFIVMLYSEHGYRPGSGPGPVVSSGWMTKVIGYTITKMPASKVVAAISVFGFDFNLTTGVNTYVTHARAMELSERYNREVIFDQDTLTPMFSYTDEQGNGARSLV